MKIKRKHLFYVLLLLLAYPGRMLFAQTQEKVYAIWGDPKDGRKVYAEKGCGKCHAINGVGPTIGPDLGRWSSHQPQTVTQIAGVMWNHAPEMQRAAKEKGVRWKSFQKSEMRDLIAFIYFLRLLDQPGNVRRGERLFNDKRCAACHAIAGRGSKIASDLSQWKHYGSPILWAEIMWQHAIEMQEKMQEMQLKWPKFKDNEILDLIAFIQSQTAKKSR
jgi:mono/diheme cytochrome c family protein